MTERALEAETVGDALSEWRRKATGLVIAASLGLHLPLLLLMLGSDSPVATPVNKATAVVSALLLLAAGCAYRASHAVRAWILLGALYLFAVVGGVVVPQGPYIRAVPIVAPMIAIGLLGVGQARACTAVSAAILMFAPSLHALPGIGPFVIEPVGVPATPFGVLSQGAGLTAEMVIIMVLLERFYGFLLQALTAQRQAAEERGAAYRRLEDEILERRRLEREIGRIGDEERRHLGDEVHDGVCQQLTGALLRCQALECRLEQGSPPTSADLEALSSLLGETIHEAHAVAEGLCPIEPSPESLGLALRALAKRTRQMSGVACEFLTEGDVTVPDPPRAHHLYRVAQEALSNAVRHARASRIALALRGGDGTLTLQVDDDGGGMPGTLPSGGMGLRTMGSRAQMLEGELTIGPAPGGGTRVSCRVPRTAGPAHDDGVLTDRRGGA